MSFIILGYSDKAHYDADDLSWDGDDVYATKEDAHAHAEQWMQTQPTDACAEVVELVSGSDGGLARRLVTQGGWEEILYPGDPAPW